MTRPLAGVNLGTLKGIGPLGQVGSLDEALLKFTNVISVTIGVITISAGIWFIIQMFIGAFQWLSSGGDKQTAENARKRLTNAVVGLFVVVASYALISLVGLIFGIKILDVVDVFNNLPTP